MGIKEGSPKLDSKKADQAIGGGAKGEASDHCGSEEKRGKVLAVNRSQE